MQEDQGDRRTWNNGNNELSVQFQVVAGLIQSSLHKETSPLPGVKKSDTPSSRALVQVKGGSVLPKEAAFLFRDELPSQLLTPRSPAKLIEEAIQNRLTTRSQSGPNRTADDRERRESCRAVGKIGCAICNLGQWMPVYKRQVPLGTISILTTGFRTGAGRADLPRNPIPEEYSRISSTVSSFNPCCAGSSAAAALGPEIP